MNKYEKLLQHILLQRSDSNVSFIELCGLLKRLGFNERIKGEHHIYTKEDVEEILNIQPLGSKAKPYQVKQIRNVIVRYALKLSE